MPPALSRIDRLAEILAEREARTVEDPDRRPAAVAVVFVSTPDAVLLIRRAEREGDRWSGQMAFPGGRWSIGDPDLLATAKRETLEEVGVDLGSARLLGRLDDVAPRSPTLPPLIVRPFVFALRERAPLSPNHEVAHAFWASIDEFSAPGVYRPFEYDGGGTRFVMPGYHLDGGVVWGMTERILTPLLELVGAAP